MTRRCRIKKPAAAGPAAQIFPQQRIVMVQQDFGHLPVTLDLEQPVTQHGTKRGADFAQIMQGNQQTKRLFHGPRKPGLIQQIFPNRGHVEHVVNRRMFIPVGVLFPRPIADYGLHVSFQSNGLRRFRVFRPEQRHDHRSGGKTPLCGARGQ